MSQLRQISVACLLIAVASGQDVKLKNGWHEDTKFGFKFKVPDKWEQVPVSVDERFIVAKYLCNREYTAKGPFPMPHKPSLRVIVFLDEAKKRVGPKVVQSGDPDASDIAISAAKTAYKGYVEYLKDTLGEGHYVDKDVESKGAGGAVCRKLDIKLDKGSLVNRRITAWTFRGDDGDYAIEFDCLEDHADKLADVFKQSLASFQFIKRAAVLTTGGATEGERVGGGNSADRKKWKEFSAEERKTKRKRDEVTRFNKTKKAMPSDWTVKESKNFYVLSHTDERYTQTVIDAAEACRKWLDDQFGDISDEYVMKGVIRIFKDYDEYRAFVRDVSDWSPVSREINTFKDASMGSRSGMDRLFQYLGRSYLSDKDSALDFGMPTWLSTGISGVLSAAVAKSGQFLTETDIYETQAVVAVVKAKKIPLAKSLLKLSDRDFYTDDAQANMLAATRLTRWLLGAGRKDKYCKTLVKDVIAAVIAIGDDPLSGVSYGDGGEAKTEEEEEEAMKKQKEASKARSAETIKTINDKALTQWTEKHWETLQKALDAAVK